LRAVLVIGYGNELRRDDGLGPKIASAIEQRWLPGLRVITCHQLTPELADPVSGAGAVIFIDAAVEGGAVEVRPLSPAPLPYLRAHRISPAALLGLARSVYGKCPPAWWITARAFDMGFGEGLTARAQANMSRAVQAFDRLWRTAGLPSA
jgi:hydrogenase maturation protease